MTAVEEIVFLATTNAMPGVLVDSNTVVFGIGSPLDSLGLVGLLIDIEQKVYDKFQKEITIASEKAMSQHRSPFRTVQTLTQFVEELCV